MTSAPRSVRVSVPASSANLGPGFDILGLALAQRDAVEVTLAGSEIHLEIVGEGSARAARPAQNLVVRTLLAALAELGEPLTGVRVVCRNAIPHGRGLGSSAAAIVAGAAAAHALVRGPDALDAAWLIDRASEVEGHPDNVAAAVLGGLTVAWDAMADDPPSPVRRLQPAARGVLRTGAEPPWQPVTGALRWHAVRLEPHPGLAPIVVEPDFGLPTRHARAALPAAVPHRDAVTTAGRAALLTAALTLHPEHLLAATADRLHQRYRTELLPDTVALVGRLRRAGLPAVVSGAGPTVLVLHDPDSATLGLAPDGWHARRIGIAPTGVAVTAAGT